MNDHALMEASLAALGDHYEGLAAELFDRFIAAHPHYPRVFLNRAAACERMTRETLGAELAQDWPHKRSANEKGAGGPAPFP